MWGLLSYMICAQLEPSLGKKSTEGACLDFNRMLMWCAARWAANRRADNRDERRNCNIIFRFSKKRCWWCGEFRAIGAISAWGNTRGWRLESGQPKIPGLRAHEKINTRCTISAPCTVAHHTANIVQDKPCELFKCQVVFRNAFLWVCISGLCVHIYSFGVECSLVSLALLSICLVYEEQIWKGKAGKLSTKLEEGEKEA